MARIKIHRSFGAVPNDLLNHPDISFKAKGLYAYLNSKPDNWDFSVESIAGQVKEGIDSVRAGIHELERYGYLLRHKYQNEKGFWEVDYILFESPVEDITYLGNSDAGEHPKQYKKEYTKKEYIKKENNNRGALKNRQDIETIVSSINQKAKTNFKPDNKETQRLISARLKEYSLQELLLVVEHKAAWLKDEKMREYYRPSTLFRPSHFENYLNSARQSGAGDTSHVNNPDYKLGAKRYRPREEFATDKQYLENCQKYGHTPNLYSHESNSI
jgi:uncharacterized phage protein (TIGR02220 family)